MDDWYYAEGDEPNGPHSGEAIRGLALNSTLTMDSLLWREGMTGWSALGDVTEFADLVPRRAPPPIPVTPPPVPQLEAVSDELPEPIIPAPSNGWAPVVEPKEEENDRFLADLAPGPDYRSGNHLQGGPWSRFFARQLDLTIWGSIFGYGLGWVLPFISMSAYLEFFKESNRVGQSIGIVAGAFVINAIVLSIFGNSPGKALFGLKAFPPIDQGGPNIGFNMSREFRVWLFGIGIGFPIVGWILAARNYGEVNQGRPARYDRGFARMEAQPIGGGRRAFAMILSIAIVVGMLVLTAWLNVADRSARSLATTWQNPVTGISTTIPAGFLAEVTNAEDGATIYAFSNPDTGVQALLAYEPTIPGLTSLPLYADAVKRATADTLQLGAFTPSGTGTLRADGRAPTEDWAASMHIRKVGETFWRVILIDYTTTRSAVGVESPTIIDALWRSVGG